MSPIQLFHILSLHLRPTMLLVSVGAVIVAVSAALMLDQPGEIISYAEASEAPLSAATAVINQEKKSWSDEWNEIHTALPERVSENIDAF